MVAGFQLFCLFIHASCAPMTLQSSSALAEGATTTRGKVNIINSKTTLTSLHCWLIVVFLFLGSPPFFGTLDGVGGGRKRLVIR